MKDKEEPRRLEWWSLVNLLFSSGVKNDPRRGLVPLLRTMAPVMDGLRRLLASITPEDRCRRLLLDSMDDFLLASFMTGGVDFFLVAKRTILSFLGSFGVLVLYFCKNAKL